MKMHDPETAAARYLAGTMRRRARRRFEGHLVDCPECWEEVRLGGLGRGFAEAGRELAPPTLRDRIRGEVSLMPGRPPGRTRLTAAALAAAVLGAAAGLLLAPHQPEAIAALVGDFRGPAVLKAEARAELPTRLGDLELTSVHAGRVDELSVVGYRYRDAAGHRVAVYRADGTFPMADGARPGVGASWRAEVEGTVLLCSDRPFPALVVGDDAREVVMAARLLGVI